MTAGCWELQAQVADRVRGEYAPSANSKVRAGIILGLHAARTLSKLDLGMRTGTEAQSTAEEGGRAHQPHHRMALASSKADELGSRHFC